MKRLASIIAATAAAAAVAAAISLPAGADSGGRASSDELAAFTSCLREHGLAVPTGLDPVALKTWLGDHEDSANFQTATGACEPHTQGPVKAPGRAPEELVSCLRDRGLDAPSNLGELKPWVAHQVESEAGRAALRACDLEPHPVSKARGDGGCAGDKSADAAKASKAKPAKTKAAPAL